MELVFERNQRIEVRVDPEKDVAAPAAVAAVWTAERHVFFTSKADGAVATIARFQIDLGTIVKHMDLSGADVYGARALTPNPSPNDWARGFKTLG
jgi:hypothetical protein